MTTKADYNRRSFPRQNLKFPMHVHCRTTKREFGQILDISLEGIRMLCTTPVKRGETYDLSLRMPRDAKNEDLAFFEVISIWTCPSPRPDSCLSGFRLLNYWQNTESHLALSSAVNDYELFLSACVADSSAEELVT